jgi:hypothetical protein
MVLIMCFGAGVINGRTKRAAGLLRQGRLRCGKARDRDAEGLQLT